MKTKAFWIYVSGLTAHAMITTGCTFHIAYIASLNGINEESLTVFFPAAVMSTVADMIGGFLQEYVDMRWLLAVVLQRSMCFFIVGLINFHATWGYWLLLLLVKVSEECSHSCRYIMAQPFGLTHLGAIGGYTMSLIVAGSALGPYSFTLSLGGKANDELQNFNHNLRCAGSLAPDGASAFTSRQ